MASCQVMNKFCQNLFMVLTMITTTSLFFLALFSLMKVTQGSDPNVNSTNSTSTDDCNLTDSFGFLIQLLLAMLAFSILVYKRYREPRYERRSMLVWSLDVSKQAIGAGFIHVFNVLASQIFFSSQDPCSLYFVNMFIDMTVGLLLLYALISMSRCMLRNSTYPLLKSGEYGSPPQAKAWLAQCGIYLSIMVVQKLLVCPLVLLPFWTKFRKFLFSPLEGHGKLEVVVVMLIVPLFINAFMFWVQDNILMRRKLQRRDSTHIEARVNLLEADEVELLEVLTPAT